MPFWEPASGLGLALQHGLATQGLTTLAVPWTLILVMLLASGAVGVLAAALPRCERCG